MEELSFEAEMIQLMSLLYCKSLMFWRCCLILRSSSPVYAWGQRGATQLALPSWFNQPAAQSASSVSGRCWRGDTHLGVPLHHVAVLVPGDDGLIKRPPNGACDLQRGTRKEPPELASPKVGIPSLRSRTAQLRLDLRLRQGPRPDTAGSRLTHL